MGGSAVAEAGAVELDASGLGVWLLKHIANRLHNELRFAFQDTQVEIE